MASQILWPRDDGRKTVLRRSSAVRWLASAVDAAGVRVDLFDVHGRVIDDYRSFTSSFVDIRDRRIRAYVQDRRDSGAQWPQPWLSLNPSFESGGSVASLVASGLLHPENERIFRVKPEAESLADRGLVLHRHQTEAITAAQSGQSYVLTTGTGSGKSLACIIPIVDAVLRANEANGGRRLPGVKAIIVYPMNALADSQLGELGKFLRHGYPNGGEPVTFARYTGQEDADERRRILAEPPDILLTNYVVLELVLTRPDERQHLIRAARGLRFLALDELHTYRGRQGADVAMLVRRVRDACASPSLQVIGTSATMSSGGTVDQQFAVVAEVATRLFGAPRSAAGDRGWGGLRRSPALPRGSSGVSGRRDGLAAGQRRGAWPHRPWLPAGAQPAPWPRAHLSPRKEGKGAQATGKDPGEGCPRGDLNPHAPKGTSTSS